MAADPAETEIFFRESAAVHPSKGIISERVCFFLFSEGVVENYNAPNLVKHIVDSMSGCSEKYNVSAMQREYHDEQRSFIESRESEVQRKVGQLDIWTFGHSHCGPNRSLCALRAFSTRET